jgi:ABC-type branched-subunit amino acid transport system ATPase component
MTRRREERARELLALLGLDRYRHTQIGALSTGTRRIAELACLVALEPRLMLLDEPSSGIAQREVEALGDVLLKIKEHLGATLVVIEHDIALVSALSDRMVAMETGRILAMGTPAEVLADDAVVVSYLGGDPTAVARTATTTRRTRTAGPASDTVRSNTVDSNGVNPDAVDTRAAANPAQMGA